MMKFLLFALFVLTSHPVFCLEQEDRSAIQEVLTGYVDSWNERECKGFADGFTEDADFVNIYGMHFKGRAEIEERHLRIMQTFLKGSSMEIVSTELREVQPGLVIALVRWRLFGFRSPGSDYSQPGVTREGIFTHVFIERENKWEITATQNTLVPH